MRSSRRCSSWRRASSSTRCRASRTSATCAGSGSSCRSQSGASSPARSRSFGVPLFSGFFLEGLGSSRQPPRLARGTAGSSGAAGSPARSSPACTPSACWFLVFPGEPSPFVLEHHHKHGRLLWRSGRLDRCSCRVGVLAVLATVGGWLQWAPLWHPFTQLDRLRGADPRRRREPSANTLEYLTSSRRIVARRPRGDRARVGDLRGEAARDPEAAGRPARPRHKFCFEQALSTGSSRAGSP